MTAVADAGRGGGRAAGACRTGTPTALLLLGHGAGGGVDSADLAEVAAAALAAGYAVARVTQPYRVAGRRSPPRAPVLDEAWLAVAEQVHVDGLPLVVGGRSSGARVACRTADRGRRGRGGRAGVPDRARRARPEKDRLAELAAPSVPVLVVQGERDPFGIPPEAPGRTVTVLHGATHTIRGPAARAAAVAVTDLAEGGPRMIYTVARELPGTLSTMAAPQGDLDAVLLSLRGQGVDTLVSLLPPDQTTMLFLTDEPNAAHRAGLAFRSLPVPDFGVPDHAEFARPLRELSDELTAGRHVAVHCWGGVGRSSMVAAALLVHPRQHPGGRLAPGRLRPRRAGAGDRRAARLGRRGWPPQ